MQDSTQGGRRISSWRASLTGAALGLALLLPGRSAAAAEFDADCGGAAPDPDCGFHNMMLVGSEGLYLSHLPMFNTEHRFQAILQAGLGEPAGSLDEAYRADRRAHPELAMYTVAPQAVFVLSRLVAEAPAERREGFPATTFRGHLERGGEAIAGLEEVPLAVRKVLYFRELRPEDARDRELRYILFGGGGELFLAHRLSQAPVGSSRVDLQACKLEYSIVSPK